MKKKKVVLVGNGMAGVRCIEELLKISPEGFEITIIGQEPHPNYNRILLSKVLQGDTTIADITINDWDWYQKHDINLLTGETVIKIDTKRQIVYTNRQRNVTYDELILATGSLPFMLPLPGADKEGVTAFRDIKDCQKMIETSKRYKKAAVIGGGLLGLEAARGLLNLGMDVHVIHIFNYIMERQLDPTASIMLQRELEKQGMKFLLEKQTERIVGKHRVEGLQFKDGTKIDVDLVVMAVGIRPNVQLAKDSGLETNHGILVNDFLQTNTPHIYALGECAEHRGTVYGLVAPIYDQAKVLARKVCGAEDNGYEGSILATQLKVSGVDVFSAGEFVTRDDTQALQMRDDMQGVYKKVLLRNDKVIGAVLFGDTSQSSSLLGMINRQANSAELKKIPFFPSSEGGNDFVSSLSDQEVVCACNNITKGAIIQAIHKEGLTTVDQVKQCTKASSSCGGCRPLVASILEYALQHEFEGSFEEVAEPICGCTAMSHEQVKLAVASLEMASVDGVKGVMETLGWQNPEGCTVCLSAMHYYVSLYHPIRPLEEERLLTPCSGLHCELGQPGGEELETNLKQQFDGLPTPYPISMNVSPCPCQGSSSQIRDIGVIGFPGGWELYAGGHGGERIQVGKLLCSVQTEQEVLEMAGALIQYYRETAYYSERTSEWIERLGIEHVRETLFNHELREQLLGRLIHAISFAHTTGSEAEQRERILLGNR
ncbi:nitrite reductase large subunit NirB [Ammoniphilus sp. 3BR4]|uniref:nitrite reductase large subunit NirB n=1 Tax=Ammoniphilus sp. 3BR4 TaxID=3158265 RepID=UPI003466184A